MMMMIIIINARREFNNEHCLSYKIFKSIASVKLLAFALNMAVENLLSSTCVLNTIPLSPPILVHQFQFHALWSLSVHKRKEKQQIINTPSSSTSFLVPPSGT